MKSSGLSTQPCGAPVLSVVALESLSTRPGMLSGSLAWVNPRYGFRYFGWRQTERLVVGR